MMIARSLAAAAGLVWLAACAAGGAPPGATEGAADPTAAPAALAQAGHHRFRIGRLEATVIHDGQLTAPVSDIWKDPAAAELGQLLTTAGLPADQVTLDIQALLVRTGDRLVLLDAGMGASPTAGRLLGNLAAAGVKPEDVTDIVISHSHADHIGGLIKDGALAFPNAQIRMTAAEWAAVSGRSANAARVAVIGPKVSTFQPGAVLAPGVRAVEVRGHTPGHTAVAIEDRGQRLLAIGDTAHHYVISLRRPEATIGFDTDAETAEASRRALLQRAADGRQRLFAPHFPYPGLGTVRREDDGFAWVPAP